jgi:hypothetical protein
LRGLLRPGGGKGDGHDGGRPGAGRRFDREGAAQLREAVADALEAEVPLRGTGAGCRVEAAPVVADREDDAVRLDGAGDLDPGGAAVADGVAGQLAEDGEEGVRGGVQKELAGDGANLIFSAMYDDTYADEASITVIATGLEDPNAEQPQPIFATRKVGSDFRFPKTDSRPAGGFSFSNHKTSGDPVQTTPPLKTPQIRLPQSKITERDIQIPDFLKRN